MSAPAHMEVGRTHPETPPVSERPGEFIHYRLNLGALFRDRMPPEDIDLRARLAVAHRVGAMDRFSHRLDALREAFEAEWASCGLRPTTSPQPFLRGWDLQELHRLRKQHPRLLVALFHYGEHRQVFADLAGLGVPYVAPVAKQAYFECQALADRGPEPFAAAMQLLEVEDPKVGRQLLKGLRSGRLGLIYVDGNMGPDGHLVEEGAVEVEFLGRRIRVKAGAARMAQALRAPVLPLLVKGAVDSEGDPPTVSMGPLLSPRSLDPSGGHDCEAMMQAIYDQLAQAVLEDPAHWEFAFCLHRWFADLEDHRAWQGSADAELLPHSPVGVSLRDIVLYERDGSDYWVHVGRQMAYRIPSWARGLHAFVRSGPRQVSVLTEWLKACGAEDEDATQLLLELYGRGLLTSMARQPEPLEISEV